jgi:hypothetical protein
MPSLQLNDEITELELQLLHYERLLEQSIRDYALLTKSKVIFHDLKLVSEKLEKLKKTRELE